MERFNSREAVVTKKPNDTDRQKPYSPAGGEHVCERVAEGESLVAICAGDAMPSVDEVKQWLRGNSEFARTLDLAIQARRENFLDELAEVAMKVGCGEIEVEKGKKEIERLKTLVEYSDLPVGIW